MSTAPATKLRVGILASGGGTASESLLRATTNGELDAEVVTVITDRRNAPVLERAGRYGIAVGFSDPAGLSSEAYDDSVSAQLRAAHVDLVLMAGYMRIVSPRFVQAWRGRLLNVHPSLLPAFAGLMNLRVHEAVLGSGVGETGCTVHHVTEQVDAGEIVLQKRCPVLPGDTPVALRSRVQALENAAFVDVVRSWAAPSLPQTQTHPSLGMSGTSSLKEEAIISSPPARDASPRVGILMGSRSDWPTLQTAALILDELGLPYEAEVISAHRTPERMIHYSKNAQARGLQVLIAGAGGAAHLPGMIAALTHLPVLGVPVQSKALNGLDSLLSIVQMPRRRARRDVRYRSRGGEERWAVCRLPAGAARPRTSKTSSRLPPAADRRGARRTRSPPMNSMLSTSAKKRIGILGAGQLAQMLAEAACELGDNTCAEIVCAGSAGDCAERVAQVVDVDLTDAAAVHTFAGIVDLVTIESENIDAAVLEGLNLFPNVHAVATAQDRLLEKRFFAEHGIGTAPFRPVDTLPQLRAAFAELGTPAILKTRRMGYDGKGQVRICAPDEAESAWDTVAGVPCILEGLVPFEAEVSLIGARGHDGSLMYYPLTRNDHREGILRRSSAPAHPELQHTAEGYLRRLLTALDYVGVLAVEFFVCKNGDLLANEMAPRVHNSGHWTIEGSATSQFANHLRALLDIELGPVDSQPMVMLNCIGSMPPVSETSLFPNLFRHDYGKEARPGRKVGHLTFPAEDVHPIAFWEARLGIGERKPELQ